MQLAVVLIFTHKPEPDACERLSFQQCFKVLGKHPIRLVCPQGMDISRYREMVPGVEADFIHGAWLKSVRAYNRLKVSPWLYRKYSGYEFMLTYELDAWVFRDELRGRARWKDYREAHSLARLNRVMEELLAIA